MVVVWLGSYAPQAQGMISTRFARRSDGIRLLSLSYTFNVSLGFAKARRACGHIGIVGTVCGGNRFES